MRAWLSSKDPESTPVVVLKTKSIGIVEAVRTVLPSFLIDQLAIVPPALSIGKKEARYSPTGAVMSFVYPFARDKIGGPKIVKDCVTSTAAL